MGLSSYLTYTVTSLELGDITNDHTQLDWVTRAKVPHVLSSLTRCVDTFSICKTQLIFEELSTRFITPCFPAQKIVFSLLFSEGHIFTFNY